MRIIIDIENNNLLANSLDYSSFPYKLNKEANLWCICLFNIDTRESFSASNKECTREWLKNALKGCTELIGHNLAKYDLVMLQLFGVLDYTIGYLNQNDTIYGNPVKIIDTLILSRLFYPDRYGGHSLGIWGERVGESKTDFRQVCIDKGHITKDALKGAEFQFYSKEMLDYCVQDTITNAKVYEALLKEQGTWDWNQAIKLENKLADKAIRRELLGFWFDKDLAINNLADLNQKMDELRNTVEPLLPPKPLNKGELDYYTLPARQISKSGEYSSFLLKFAEKHNCKLENNILTYKEQNYILPYQGALETHQPGEIDNLDHVKMYLIELGWSPQEWKQRDLTKDSKKQSISYEKRIKALHKWYDETINGKYTEQRFAQIDTPRDEIINLFSARLREDRQVMVPTSPNVRVGLEKELCPNLTALGEKVAFANDFALYLTYKHRRNSIAGGDVEDMDFDRESPNTGFLSMYREQDGRVPAPSIEVGAATNRYRHIGIANIARATSIYGKEMRSMFGAGNNRIQMGYDFSSLEARVQGHYCYNYTDGIALAETFLAEKPNDLHSLNAKKLNMNRSDVKSFYYAVIYGAQATKIAKMLNCSKQKAQTLLDELWDAMPALKELKEKVIQYWESTNNKYILGIDGRKIFVRSKHSLLNYLFQSAGVICTKYSTISAYKELEKQGLCTDPLIGNPDFCSMIEYHDEAQLYINPKLINFKTFNTEDEANRFVENWDITKGQLSSIGHGKNNTFYVALPNIVSKAISNSINKTAELLKLNVNLGMEFSLGKSWYDCH